MSNHNNKVLAIDPGTKYMGVAFLDEGDLVYHGVEVIKKQKAPHLTLRECRKVILRFIQGYRPQVLAVEKTFFANNRNSALLNVLVDEIRAIGRRKGLRVVAFAPSKVKKVVAGNGRASKRDVASVVIARYPNLKVHLPQNRKWKERFWCNAFDAVAIGMVAAKVGQGKGLR